MFAVVLDTPSIERTARGLEIGVIYLRVGDVAFPREGWTDFVTAILGGWNLVVVRALVHRIPVRGMFMEGPFAWDLFPNAGDDAILRCGDGREEISTQVSLRELALELHRASRELTHAYDLRGWTSRDITALTESARRLQDLLRPARAN